MQISFFEESCKFLLFVWRVSSQFNIFEEFFEIICTINLMIRAIIDAMWLNNHNWIQTSPIWLCYNFIISWNFLHIQFTSLQYQSIPYEVQSTSKKTYFVIFKCPLSSPLPFLPIFLHQAFFQKPQYLTTYSLNLKPFPSSLSMPFNYTTYPSTLVASTLMI